MEEFKKDLLKVCGKNTAALIIFFVLGGVFLAFGLLMWITAYDPFDAQTDGYATMEVTYVMGPFAELTSDGKDHTEFYIAEDSEGYWLSLIHISSFKRRKRPGSDKNHVGIQKSGTGRQLSSGADVLSGIAVLV